MANPVWPPTLPQSFPKEHGRQREPRTVADPSDSSIREIREITTASPTTHQITLVLTDAQRSTLDTFWDATLRGGSRRFDWTDPWPGAGTLTFRLPTAPREAGFSASRLARVALVLEEVP